jgi:hypothetical protein
VSALGHVRPRRKDGVALRRSGGEIILYDPDEDRVHFVNVTAAAIWELCDGTTDEVEMVTAICQLTGLPAEVVEEDVARLVGELVETGLVTFEELDT